ncbi:hypothetical protein B296_00032828 [Ensete ventricosum]|uniref:Uncharacterized protein n=1 Tax=Ensete ventricosum TaxID=4639 RepID=A0A426Z968_ENSVE|nr:hypothetical protein B296_00032828 [Ensete ventricosum]
MLRICRSSPHSTCYSRNPVIARGRGGSSGSGSQERRRSPRQTSDRGSSAPTEEGQGLEPAQVSACMEKRVPSPMRPRVRNRANIIVWRWPTKPNAGWVIGVMDNKVKGLRKEMVELKAGSGSKAIAAESLELDLDNFHLLLANSQEQLKDVRARGRVIEDELLKMTRAMEGLKVKVPKVVVAAYMKSTGFEMGLVRTGQVSYEYEYQVALAQFRTQYPELKIEEDPFKILPEDSIVPMEAD